MNEIIIIIMLIILLFIVKLMSKNCLNPYFIMSIIWSVFILMGLIVFKSEVNWNYIGLIWIILACLLFMTGNIIGMSMTKNCMLKNNENIKVSNISWKFILICITIGLLRCAIEIKLNGFSFKNILDINTLFEINSEMAYKRYNGESINNPIMQVLLIFVYAAPLCGGYGFVYSENKYHKIICISTFIPTLINLLITNTKAGMIASVLLWISSFMVGYLEKHKQGPKLNKILNIKNVILVVIILMILYLSMILRIGRVNTEVINIVNNKFKIYSLGHIFAFDNWFFYDAFKTDYTLGGYTFLAIFNTLGLAVRNQGVFNDITYNLTGNGTNVYTVFRGIISDFGVVGGLIFFMIIGLFSGYSFKKVSQGKKKTISSRLILTATYFFIFFSMIVSPWTYNSYILAFVIFALYLLICWKKIR